MIESVALPPAQTSQAARNSQRPPAVSIVVPVFNEEQNLRPLFFRLSHVIDQIRGGAEVIFVDDGSFDHSLDVLRQLAENDRRIRVLSLSRNCGQHAALFAGFDFVCGRTVVTMDADLQNPPEDIPRLLAKIEEGFDVAGGWRTDRKDSLLRRWASSEMNRFARRFLRLEFRDCGCMLRAYSRQVVDSMRRCEDGPSFIPALACRFSKRMAEIPVGHDRRLAGKSRYSLAKLLKLQADLLGGFLPASLHRRRTPAAIKEKINFDRRENENV